MGRYSRGFRRAYGRKGIVKDGLVLHLDGRDFKNNPATSMWMDRVNTYPENMVKYNPVTWSEWTKILGATTDSTGLTLTADGTNAMIAYTNTNLKVSTKYGILYNVVSSTVDASTFAITSGTGAFSATNLTTPSVGNNKHVATTPSSIANNLHKIVLTPQTTGKAIKTKDFRIFELPTGSQIESDFTNLTADQLAIKYPMQRAALPYNFGYIAPYAQITSDYVGKVSGSVVENPNICKRAYGDALIAPSAFTSELNTIPPMGYSSISTLNAESIGMQATLNPKIPQTLFSFNLIEIFERRYGTIPSTDQTTAGKVAWLKANIKIGSGGTFARWHGYGSCPSGNMARFKAFYPPDNTYYGSATNTTNSIGICDLVVDSINYIDVSGFIHFLAYTDASDGVTPSTIYTDYIKLDLTFKAASGSDHQGGVVFDGVDDFLKTSPIGITGNSPFTIMFKGGFLSNTAGDDVLLAYAPADASFGGDVFGIYARATSSKFRISTYTANDYDTGFNKDYNEHIWALVYDGTGTLLYQDGVVDSVGKKTATNPTFQADSILYMGKLGDANFTIGSIDKVVMYNKGLTAQEIKQNTLAMR